MESVRPQYTASEFELRGYDYDIEHVPLDARKSTASLTVIWIGWAFQFATIIVGGIIGAGLPLATAIWAIIIGDVILALLSITTGLIGRRTGLGFSMLTRYPFGHVGTLVPSFIAGLVQLGWLTFCYWIFALTVANILPFGVTAGYIIGLVVIVLITAIPVAYGYEGPKWVAWVTIPLFLIPLGVALWLIISNAGGPDVVFTKYVPPKPVSFIFAVNLAMGAWFFGALTCPDWTRLGKSDWAAYIAPPAGLIIGESLVLILGATTSAATMGKTWNPVEATAAIGGATALAVLLTYLVGMWNTTAPTAWSASMQFANVFKRPKTIFGVILSFFAFVGALVIQFSVGAGPAMDAFLGMLSAIVPPAAGIVVCQYWFVSRGKLPHVWELKRQINPIAFVVWIIAALIDTLTRNAYSAAGPGVGVEYGLPGLNGFIIAIVAYYVLTMVAKAFGSKELTPEMASER